MNFNGYLLVLMALLLNPCLLFATEIKISLVGIRNNHGTINMALYNNKSQFMQSGAEYRKLRVKAGTRVIRIDSIPPGEYAMSIFHDENSDGILNKNLFGIPVEGYGFSDNTKGLFGPPSFKEASFQVNKQNCDIVINITY